ncbi:Arginase [Balamuthia mandrillaris]
MQSDDARTGDWLVAGEGGDVVLLGFPHDEGVRRNGGRVGAALAPTVLRQLMPRIGTVVNPEYEVDLTKIKLSDGGDVGKGLELEEAHEALRKKVGQLVAAGKIPFVVGGGNDQSYPNAAGLLDGTDGTCTIGVINIDAHFDVRPLKEGKVHSGSPFRLLLEDARFEGKEFVEFAAQGNQCSIAHANYIKEHKGRIFWFSELRRVQQQQQKSIAQQFQGVMDSLQSPRLFVSFDLDAVRSSDAPGVSCPATIGLSAEDALEICFAAGKDPRVALFDLSEYNPQIEDYRTGRLVANMFYFFALGVAARSSSSSSS